MQPLELNLASRPFKNNTLLWAGYGLALVLLGAFSVWNVRTWRQHSEYLRDLEGKVSNIEEEFTDLTRREAVAQRAIKGADLKGLAIRTRKANEMIQWKSFSWTELFNVLESVQPNDVRMVSVHPVFRRPAAPGAPGAGPVERQAGSIPVSVEGLARNDAAFFELERALQAAPHFDRVEPERTARMDGTGETIFELSFLYDPQAAPISDPAAEPAAPADEQAPAGATAESGPVAGAAAQPDVVTTVRAEGWERQTPPAEEQR